MRIIPSKLIGNKVPQFSNADTMRSSNRFLTGKNPLNTTQEEKQQNATKISAKKVCALLKCMWNRIKYP